MSSELGGTGLASADGRSSFWRFGIQLLLSTFAVGISLSAAIVARQEADAARRSSDRMEQLESARRADEVFEAERLATVADYWAPGECSDKAELVSFPMKHFYGEEPPRNMDEYMERCNSLSDARNPTYAVRTIEVFGLADRSSRALVQLDYSVDDPLRTKSGQTTVMVEFDPDGNIVGLDEVVDRN